MQTHWIDNRPIASRGAALDEMAVVNPATEEVVATIPKAGR